jgi:tetratricopeptide (TPR) repeat protein
MSDSLRGDSSRPLDTAPEPTCDAKIEELLLSGLDHYFAAQYEHAINIWTRALFLDRSHPRARAYIDRARSALAERQRASDELLESGVAAFHRGESARARRLLRDALDQGAHPEAALNVLDRLNRLEHVRQAATGTEPRPSPAPASTRVRRYRSRVGLAVAVALLPVVAGAGLFIFRGSEPARGAVPAGSGPATSASPAESLPLPRRGEDALNSARTLVATGRLRDALTALDRVRPTDPQKADADRLRAELQKRLIELEATRGPAASSPAGAGRP